MFVVVAVEISCQSADIICCISYRVTFIIFVIRILKKKVFFKLKCQMFQLLSYEDLIIFFVLFDNKQNILNIFFHFFND